MQLTLFSGEPPDYHQRWLRVFSGLQSTYNGLGSVNRYTLMHRGRNHSMGEPRAHLPGELRFEEDSSNEVIGLLRARDGDPRGPQWTDTVYFVEGPSSFRMF